MPPKRKKKKCRERFRCDEIEGERFHTQADDVFRYNWWEVFCFPYILCSRFWDCCVSLFAGTNQCLVYWMVIQWLVCKITKITTPDPIIFPYYFYMFCQVILLTLFFIMIWVWFGKTVFTPFFVTFWDVLPDKEVKFKSMNTSRLSFRRYCFRKGEIFDTSIDSSAATHFSKTLYVFSVIIDFFIIDVHP